MEFKFKDFRGQVIKRILGDKMTHYNDAIFDLTDEEIKKGNVWRNKEPIPSKAEQEAEWLVLEKELVDAEVEKQKRVDRINNQPLLEEFAEQLLQKDSLLGFKSPKDAIEFIFERDYGSPEKALGLLKANIKK